MPLLVFEGGDGAGKTTVMDPVHEALETQGFEVVRLREPGSTRVGERVRDLLLDPECGDLAPWTEAALFTASRAQMVREEILPALHRGAVVLLDRYFYSTVVYQGYAANVPLLPLIQMSLSAVENCLPDGVLLLDVPAEVAAARRTGVADRMESKGTEFFERVRAGYLDLASKDALFFVLDATAPRAQLAERAIAWALATIGRAS